MAEASIEDGQASQGTDADGPPLPCSDGAAHRGQTYGLGR